MTQRTTVVGIDVGSTKVAAVIGAPQEKGIDIIGVGYAPSHGVRKGVVVDIEETVSSISAALEEAERMSGTPITRATVSIGGTHIEASSSRGVVAVSSPNNEITDNDVLRVLDNARSTSVPPNREILMASPRSYAIDGNKGIKDPVGMSGIRLEVDTQVISGGTAPFKSLTKCLEQATVTVSDFIFTPVAASQAVMTKRQREIGSIIIDLGGGTTSFAVFEEGDILHAGVLPIGATHITNDIAIGLRTTVDTAEVIKVKYGCAVPDSVQAGAELDLRKVDKHEEGKVELRYVAEIIEARLNEILCMVRDELRAIGREGTLPAGAVLTGGGAKQAGIVELAKDILRLPVHVGQPAHEISGMVDNVSDPLYAASIGLMLLGAEAAHSSQGAKRAQPMKLSAALEHARNVFRKFVP